MLTITFTGVTIIGYLLGHFFFWNYDTRTVFQRNVDYYREKLSTNPEDFDTKIELAWVSYLSGEGAQVEKEIAQIVKENPEELRVLLLYGFILAEQGRYQEAIKPLAKGHRGKPNINPPLANYYLGLSYMATGQTEQGVRHLEQATLLDPASALYYYQLGLAYKNMGRYQEAQKSLIQALTFGPYPEGQKALEEVEKQLQLSQGSVPGTGEGGEGR